MAKSFRGNVTPNQEVSIEWTPQNAGIHTLTFSAVLPVDDTNHGCKRKSLGGRLRMERC